VARKLDEHAAAKKRSRTAIVEAALKAYLA
jgi:predicted transcriptional regulator